MKHPRFHIHFTPTSATWLNMVERFFCSISTDRLERGILRSVPELIAAIEEYISMHNQNPKPKNLRLDGQGQRYPPESHSGQSTAWFKEK